MPRTSMLCAVALFAFVGGVAAETAVTPPWASRADIPSGCEVQVKIPKQGRCLFHDQCSTDFCCPYFQSCLDKNGLQQSQVKDMGDTLRLAMVWGEGGPRASYDGQQLRTSAKGNTDVCNRDNAQQREIGRCESYNNGIIALKDSGDLVKAFDLANAECQCDSRFQELYKEGKWTGMFVNGTFRNYYDPDYYLAQAAAANCPTGWARIVEIKECQAAIAYLGLEDSTAGQFGADAFPGCVNNVLKNQVAFNKQNTATTDFALTRSEQYICKKLGATTTAVPASGTTAAASGTTAAASGTTAAPSGTTAAASGATAGAGATKAAPAQASDVQIKGSMQMTVSDPEAFVSDAACNAAIVATLANLTKISEDDFAVVLSVLVARRLDVEGRRLAGDVSADYTISMPLVAGTEQAAGILALKAASPAALTSLVSSSVALRAGAGAYTVNVTKGSAPVTITIGAVSFAGPRAGASAMAISVATLGTLIGLARTG